MFLVAMGCDGNAPTQDGDAAMPVVGDAGVTDLDAAQDMDAAPNADLAMASSQGGPAPTAASAASAGSYSVAAYSSGVITKPDFSVYKVFYPSNGPGNAPGVVYIPGYNPANENTYVTQHATVNGHQTIEEDTTEWGTLLASHGFVVMFIDPVDGGVDPTTRAAILLEAVSALAAENTRPSSPIFGKLDANKLAVMGHSYGGAGALYAANMGTDPRVKAAVGLSPVPTAGDYSSDAVPSLILGGVGDPYVSDFPAEYDGIPSTTSKACAVFPDLGEFDSMHEIALVPLGTHSSDPTVARLGHSFLEVYLMGDSRYAQFLVMDPAMSSFSSHL